MTGSGTVAVYICSVVVGGDVKVIFTVIAYVRWVKNRDIFAAKMTAEQIAEAQRRAREWDAAHPRDP